jgi:hypothetical protein
MEGLRQPMPIRNGATFHPTERRPICFCGSLNAQEVNAPR